MSDDINSQSANPQPPKKELRPRDPERWIRRPMEKDRKGTRALEFRPGPAFFALADPVCETKRTLLGYDRLYVFWQAIRNVASLPGSAAEIGSFRGGSAYFIASAFLSMTGEEVPLHVFDTFEGHPAQAITDHDPFHTPGQFNNTSYDDVREYLSPFRQVQIHKGDVSGSLPHLPEDVYRLVHIDTDLYQPTIACLEYFSPRVPTGGVVVIDDYASKNCPGVPKAVLEYMERADDFDAWDMRTEQLMLVKR
jgi:O-methyltransferase